MDSRPFQYPYLVGIESDRADKFVYNEFIVWLVLFNNVCVYNSYFRKMRIEAQVQISERLVWGPYGRLAL